MYTANIPTILFPNLNQTKVKRFSYRANGFKCFAMVVFAWIQTKNNTKGITYYFM